MNNTKQYQLPICPVACKEAVVRGDKYRFTVLTDRLIRMEYQEEGRFTDEPTRTVLNREFPVPEFRVIDEEEKLEIVTDALHLYYDKKEFSSSGLYVILKERFSISDSVWNYGDEILDLRGTARTLDNADGAVELEQGLMSVEGFTVLDDSDSAIVTEDGWVSVRQNPEIDLYFWGYGHDYLQCLQDFYRLSGYTPLLPKYTMGNWWSRYYPYTEESYLKLMEDFSDKDIPISVSVIDMDWHITKVPSKYGSGWTGYTWNKELFPDPERFLGKLHEMGKHVTLNLHPADGVRAFEDAYLPMAKELNADYAHEEKIPFDVTNKKFMDAYFKFLHHPNEEIGVDFWWVDWQQGSVSRTKGVDPLWMLNHLHFMDSGRDGKLPLTFSRYAGIGSHRYPVGFSGDTITTWESLQFQPYFTANATNVGYTWWSHDIGGHQRGIRDDELEVRWVQFGVFSPIMRLHSTSNEFYGKEPWNYNMIAENAISNFMRLRHKLVPYLYTMNYRTHLYGIPLIQPMYYKQDVPDAYNVGNEYYFGELIVCPITSPTDRQTGLAEFDAWIPDGTYIDFFTGQVYQGGCRQLLYRDLDTIPVLAPVGSIVPMAGDYTDCCVENPKELDVLVFHGANGRFELFEDDCSNTIGMEPVITVFTYDADEMSFTMQKGEDLSGSVPEDRSYCVRIRGLLPIENVMIEADGQKIEWTTDYDKEMQEAVIKIWGKNVKRFTLKITTLDNKVIAQPNRMETIRRILHRAQMEYDTKDKAFRIIQEEENPIRILSQLQEMKLNEALFRAILEQLASDF